VTAEIITIGDELLIGQVVNTNASYIAKELIALGIDVRRTTTIGDDAKAIAAAFKLAWKQHDVVIVTGGLGPTHDDISKAAVAKFFGKKLVLHAPTLKAVKERFAKLGYAKMPEVNVGQAMAPEDFKVLRNDRGTAPGLLYYDDEKTFVIVPGVPAEMEFILATGVIPFLRKAYRARLSTIMHRTLLTSGIGESALAELIGDPKEFLNSSTTLAFLPAAGTVRLRITTNAKTPVAAEKELSRVERVLRDRAGKHIVADADIPLEQHIVRLMRDMQKTLSTAESCTGGLIAQRITAQDGASSMFRGGVVAYHNDLKTGFIAVNPKTLEKHGAVSEETARELAEGAVREIGSDYGIGVTGIAGPSGGTPEKPVGTIWIALAEKGQKTVAKKLSLDFGRVMNRERAAIAALELLRRRLVGLDKQQ
jgi:nicotinamide-nucleotide amidase